MKVLWVLILSTSMLVGTSAQAGFSPFFGLSVPLTETTEIQHASIYANWEYIFPDGRVVEGGAEAWKKPAKIPRRNGARFRVNFPVNTLFGRNVKGGVYTAYQSELEKHRPSMRYFPAKGWGFELLIGGSDRHESPLREAGIFTYWGTVDVNDAVRIRRLGLFNVLKDAQFEWLITFALYEPPDGATDDDLYVAMQAAKGSGGVSLLPPRTQKVIVPIPPEDDIEPQAGSSDDARVQDSAPKRESDFRTFDLLLLGEGFTQCEILVMTPNRQKERLFVKDGGLKLRLPVSIPKIKIYVIYQGREIDTLRDNEWYDLADPSPIRITYRAPAGRKE